MQSCKTHSQRWCQESLMVFSAQGTKGLKLTSDKVILLLPSSVFFALLIPIPCSKISSWYVLWAFFLSLPPPPSHAKTRLDAFRAFVESPMLTTEGPKWTVPGLFLYSILCVSFTALYQVCDP